MIDDSEQTNEASLFDLHSKAHALPIGHGYYGKKGFHQIHLLANEATERPV